MSTNSIARSERHRGVIAASACAALTPGLSRAITVSHDERRFSRSFQPGVTSGFVIMGMNILGVYPAMAL